MSKILEAKRFELQQSLDSQKSSSERNKMGQFSTPSNLALEILKYSKSLFKRNEKIRFLDPALGTGVFYSALSQVFPDKKISEALGFEIDPHYATPTIALWKKTSLEVRLKDFTSQKADGKHNLVICNPPYVRHHHLDSDYKTKLQQATYSASGMKLSGLAGLYCHFLGLSHKWMADGGIAGWLIPSEFMDVNYGAAVKKYLLEEVTLLRIHRFNPNDVQFADALVSSAIVWFKNAKPPEGHEVEFSYGGSLLSPELSRFISAIALTQEPKWTRFPNAEIRKKTQEPVISDFFKIKRGIATGDNNFFILNEATIKARKLPWVAFKPILPSPRHLSADEINADKNGYPSLDKKLYLLDIRLQESEIKIKYPSLWEYLEEGKNNGLSERYICRHRPLWYAQENRPAPPIVCTYLGRGDMKSKRPFRFILNNSKATIANVYLAMYPTEAFAAAIANDSSILRGVWKILNSISPQRLLDEGRVYGGGLHKLEPKELANVPVPDILKLLPKNYGSSKQQELF